MTHREDDDLLSRLGAHARETRAEADADPEVIAANAPLDAAARARIADRMIARLAEKKAPAEVVPLGRRAAPAARRAVGIAAIAFAAAAAILVAVLPRHASLPPYALVATGGDRELRSVPSAAPEEIRRLEPASRLEIVLRPATATTSNPRVRAFLVRAAGVTAWSPKTEVSPEGAVRIAGTASELFPGEHGDLGVLLLVGEGAVADPAEVFDGRDPGPGVQAMRLRVRLVP